MPPNRNAAGDLPEGDNELKGSLTIKTGIREFNPRGGKTLEFRFKASEGYPVLKVRIQQIAKAADEQLPEDFQIFFKRSKNATQQKYTELHEDSFLDLLKARWSRATQLDLDRWSAKNVTPIDGTVFEMFVYKPPTRRKRTQWIHRATGQESGREQARIDVSARDNNLQTGRIRRDLMATRYARSPEGTPIEIRNDSSNNKAAELYRRRQDNYQSDQAEEEEGNRPVKIIRLQFGVGSAWSDVRVDVSSLRRALGIDDNGEHANQQN